MKHHAKLFFVLALTVLAIQDVARGQGSATTPDVEGHLELFETWVSARIAFGELPSISVAIVYGDDIVYANGFGYADLDSDDRASSRTIYRVGSVSKMFTAVSVLQLRDRGLLSLDDTVSQHLPWFGREALSPDARGITIRQLLSHTSGLRFEAGAPGIAYWQSQVFPTSQEIIDAAAEVELAIPPRSRWKYSNWGFVLLGEIVEAVSGQSYEQYVQREILDPLGMNSTSFGAEGEYPGQVAVGYGRILLGSPREAYATVEANGLNAAAGLFSTVEDLGKFLAWQLGLAETSDSRILAASTLQEMHRAEWLDPSWASARGLGFEIIHSVDRDLIGHSGLFPGYQAAAYISQAENTGVVVLANSYTSPLFDEVVNIRTRAFDWIAPLLAATNGNVTAPTVPEEWNDLEGIFRTQWRDFLVLAIDGKLGLLDPAAADPKAGMARLLQVSGDTYRIEGTNSVPIGELVVFERDQGGSVTAIRIADWGRATRVSY